MIWPLRKRNKRATRNWKAWRSCIALICRPKKATSLRPRNPTSVAWRSMPRLAMHRPKRWTGSTTDNFCATSMRRTNRFTLPSCTLKICCLAPRALSWRRCNPRAARWKASWARRPQPRRKRACPRSSSARRISRRPRTEITPPWRAANRVRFATTMTIPAERQDTRLMREMFNKIAPKYDFITRGISYGMDGRWKRLGVLRASLPENALVLDLASGTGDFSRLVRERLPAARSVAVDLSEGMLRVGRRNGLQEAVCADATALPFASASFNCVFIGYGFFNFFYILVGGGGNKRTKSP